MGKKDIHVAVTIIFASVLSIFAMTGGNTERGEIRQIEDSIRNLRRTDNLQFSYTYTISDKNEIVATRTEVWADQLTSRWVAEYYTTDADGTRLYLKRFCDGMDVYTYVDWNGEWVKQGIGQNMDVPCFDNITSIHYRSEDITNVQMKEEGDISKISYTFTPEYLDSIDEKNYAELDAYYRSYDDMGYSEKSDDEMYMAMEQYRKMSLEDMLIIYKMDGNDVLRSGTYSFTVNRPEIKAEEDGTMSLGNEEKIRNLIVFEIRGYNKDFISDRIEQYASEIL